MIHQNNVSSYERFLLSSYHYHLPPELIAQDPANPRDSSRFMVCDLEKDTVDHTQFRDLESILDPGDVLVLNDSRVIPARIRGHKPTGGKAEVLFLNALDTEAPLEALIKGRVPEGGIIIPDTIADSGNDLSCNRKTGHAGSGNSNDHVKVRVVRHIHEGRFEVEILGADGPETLMNRYGEMPLPPYIRKPLDIKEKYQTVFSRESGSIAAPTAGLHFTNDLLDRLKTKGIRIVTVTLHVSIGTFLPVRENDIRKHTMEPEYFILGNEVSELLGSRETEVVGVGTTVVKTLESAYYANDKNGGDSKRGRGHKIRSEGWSDLFIYPGHEFRSPLKGMITNFHLPSSTLIMLVSAYAGRDTILKNYREAVRERYRFYSFGDAMFLKGKPVGSCD